MEELMGVQRIPKLGIGIPVYNGENFLEDALNSLLDQTFQDFEMFISDNGSTDKTEKICRKYSESDSRIHYTRYEQNRGVTWNFNNVFRLSRNEYFKWAPHDDLYHPTFLEKCTDVLDHDNGVVLCYAKTIIIDETGKEVKKIETKLRVDNDKPHVRFHDLLVDYLVYEQYGIIRSDGLKKTPLFGGYGHEDGVILAHLGLIGRYQEIPEYLYYNREHPQKSWNFYKTYREYTVYLDPTKAGKILLPRWRMGFEYIKAVTSVPLYWREKFLCYFQMVFWVRIFWKSLIANVLVAFVQILMLPFRKPNQIPVD
jgi:glycosyltransferase involved in cell wall biosynthesis